MLTAELMEMLHSNILWYRHLYNSTCILKHTKCLQIIYTGTLLCSIVYKQGPKYYFLQFAAQKNKRSKRKGEPGKYRKESYCATNLKEYFIFVVKLGGELLCVEL